MFSLVSIGKKVVEEVSKNSPVILIGMAVAGVVSTVILAVRATPTALGILEDELDVRFRNFQEDGDGMSSYVDYVGLENENAPTIEWSRAQLKMFKKKDIVKLTWKCYIPTAAVGLVTIACIIGAHNVHLRRNAALASLYSLTESAFKEYQAKIVETIGKNKELKARDEITTDHIKRNPTGDAEIIFTGKGETLCYDSMSGRYFKTDLEKVRRAEAKLNRQLMSDSVVTLNEFYDELGLSHIKLGRDIGWNVEKANVIISFSAQLTDTDEPCLVLNYEVVPIYRFH